MAIDFKQDILAPVANDFAAMDTFINEGITSKVAGDGGQQACR